MTRSSARVDVVHDTYFGTTVADPYRWMEDWSSDEAQAWIAEQAAYARQTLEALPERAALLDYIAELSGASSSILDMRAAGGRCFYRRSVPGAELPRLFVRLTPDSAERVLWDSASVASAMPTTLDWYMPSPDGRLVAYGISEGGSENSILHILDVDSGAQLPDTISRVYFGYVSWLEHNEAFVYHRYPDAPARCCCGSRSRAVTEWARQNISWMLKWPMRWRSCCSSWRCSPAKSSASGRMRCACRGPYTIPRCTHLNRHRYRGGRSCQRTHPAIRAC